MSPEEEHREFSREMKERFLKSLDNVDKQTVLISSGGLALSLTFVEKLGASDSPYVWLLVLSWIAFAITLMGTLFSHWFSSRYHATTISEYNDLSNIDYDRRNELEEQYLKFITKLRRYDKRIGWVNNSTLVTLCTGVTLLVTFVSFSILNPKTMTKEQQNPIPTSPNYPKPDTKGLPLPTPPRMPLTPQTPPPPPETPKK